MKNPSSLDLFEAVLAYHKKGYSVMPVSKNKKPMLHSWKEFQTTAADEEQLMKWWKEQKQANIGIITGKISNLTVLDIDTKNNNNATAILAQFPPTYTVQTPSGGYHLYYLYSPNFTISANAYPQFPYVDLRSDGGYVVAPPSTNAKGEYRVLKDIPLAPFPIHLFTNTLFPLRKRRKLSSLLSISTGSRNDTITSFIGTLLHSVPEKEWTTEVWEAALRANQTYTPPLPLPELRATFESILNKEIARRAALIRSPIQLTDPQGGEISITIKKNKAGQAYSNMANILAVLQQHPYYKGTIRYNTFRQEIEYKGQPLEDGDILKIQHFMQSVMDLHSATKDSVHAAIAHYANENQYDEAKDWLLALKWDGTSRLASWVSSATGVADSPYHQGIGAQWFMGMVRRIMQPGCTFDYCLVLVGAQGIGKTSLFRILGGPWYKSYTGAIDNKDFYLALRGAMIVDLDEGAALYRSEAIKIKSIITDTHDEYRAPYDRVMKKYPRRFVFSMSTNDTEPFRDITGNRRYWTIDGAQMIDFKWLEENREQLFAEAYDAYLNKKSLPEVPLDVALAEQEAHLPEDSWTDLVMTQIQKSPQYCKGDATYSVTIGEMFKVLFPDESMSRLDRSKEMRIASIFKKNAGLEKRRETVDGERKTRWMLMPKKIAELQEHNAKDTRDGFDTLGEETIYDKPF